MYIQLKPHEEAFYRFTFNKLEGLDIIILCEGRDDVECFKAISEKLNVKISKTIGVTNCRGIRVVPKILTAIIALLKIIRKVKIVAVLVDAEDLDFEERAKSILNSIRARGFRVGELQSVCYHTYKTCIVRNCREVDVVIAVNGNEKLPFNKHKIEDNIITLMILEKKMSREHIEKCKDLKELVGKVSIKALIRNSKRENVMKAFRHLVCLIESIKNSRLSY